MDWIKDLRQAGDHAVRLDTDLEYFREFRWQAD